MALGRKRDKEKEYPERVYADRERAHREAPSFSARFPKEITLCILDSLVQLRTRNLSRRSMRLLPWKRWDGALLLSPVIVRHFLGE